MQPELQKHPSSVVKDPLPHQRPAIHNQATPKLNHPKVTLQQQQKINAIIGQLNGQQKAVPDLLSQQKSFGLNNRHTHRLGRQVNASTFNGQRSNIGMQKDHGNIHRVPQPELQPQAQPSLHRTRRLQPGKQQPNLQVMSQMPMQPQEDNIQVMAEGTFQTLHSAADDWKEQLYNKITNLKNSFLPALKVKHREIATLLQKMESIPRQQRTADYEKLQRLLVMNKKVYSFLNFSKDKMSEQVRRWLPQCEKFLYNVLQDRNHVHISSSQQKQLPISDAHSQKQPAQLESQNEQRRVTVEGNDKQLQKRQRTQTLTQHREQRGLRHHQQSVNLQAHHSSHFNLAVNVSTPYNSSTDIDMNNLEKASRNIGHRSPSPFSVDPSTSSVQSLMKEDQTLLHCANTGDIQPQSTSSARDSNGSVVVTVAGISPSGWIAENMEISVKQGLYPGTDLCESSEPEEPIQRLIEAVRSMSDNAFSASASGMESVLRMVDSVAGQVAGNGSEFAVGDDLAVTTTCCYRLKRDTSSQRTQRNLYARAIPVPSLEAGMINDGPNRVTDHEASRLESSIATHDKKPRIVVDNNLLEEIREINVRLIETVVELCQDDFMSSTTVSMTEIGEGTVVRCFYTPVAISPNMKSELASFPVSPIMPLNLLVPVNYPAYSPEILDKLPSEISGMYCDDLSTKAKSKLMLNLRILHQPMSLADIARTWDTCARAVISEFSQNLGGGSFSSTYGTWKIYSGAA